MLKKIMAVATLGAIGTSAFAQSSTQVSGLVTSGLFSDATAGVVAVAGALISLYVIIKGARIVIRMVRGG